MEVNIVICLKKALNTLKLNIVLFESVFRS